MNPLETCIFRLHNFEGPLDFLVHLVQKNEIDIYEVFLREVCMQYKQKAAEHSDLDEGAEFVGNTSFLLWLKSKTLLPKHEQTEDSEPSDPDPQFEIIHQLLDYCRFKQAAKELSQLESKQSLFYARGSDAIPDVKKPLGIEHLSLEDLASLFQKIVAKAAVEPKCIEEENWRVQDKITLIRHLLKDQQKIAFEVLFTAEMSRGELIVTFLAMLELIKMGVLKAIRDQMQKKVYLCHE